MIMCNKTLHYLTKFMNNDVIICHRQNKATKNVRKLGDVGEHHYLLGKFGAVNQTNSHHHPSWYGQSACCIVSNETTAILIFGGNFVSIVRTKKYIFCLVAKNA